MDRFAVLLSLACMIHCLAIPLLAAVLPIVGGALLPDREFHWVMLGLVLPASLWALTSGCRRHRRLRVAAIGSAGLGVLIGVALFGHTLFGPTGERLATSAGAVLVAVAHVLNYRHLHATARDGCATA
jgi:hypothetical protein